MKIGFIGLGIMGRPMSKNLLKTGHELVIFARREGIIEEFRELGAEIATAPAGVASASQTIFTMLPNSPEVREVVLGVNGLIETAKPGTTIIDLSSIDPMESRAIGRALAEKEIGFMDAPVSGGEPKAIDGTLAIMVGATEEQFKTNFDLLSAMAGSVVHVGDLGAGNIAKLANNMIVALNIAAVSEAFVFAKKAGVDPAKVYEAIRGGLAGSNVMDAKIPMMLEGNRNPGFRINLHIKDLNNAQIAARNIHAPAPMTAQVMEVMQYLASQGYASEDHSSIVKYFEALSGVSLVADGEA